MLDKDLADLYGVKTKSLNLAVKRNIERFPEDFMFRLNKYEYKCLRFHFETSNKKGGRRYLPYVFTELGVAMLSSVLTSKKAIQINMQIMRTFIKIKEIISSNKSLRKKIEALEKKYNNQFKVVFNPKVAVSLN
ncbi:MAG: ORF6N domain-containing protein [Candidatus Margulisbacteria bacterium]|nr:ORF6N domain-containing protein [Candidatus Margulisiibacteriota bacterium]